MKKPGIILTALLLTLALCACGNESASVGVIGGADGPSSILVTDGKDSASYTVTDEGVTKNETASSEDKTEADTASGEKADSTTAEASEPAGSGETTETPAANTDPGEKKDTSDTPAAEPVTDTKEEPAAPAEPSQPTSPAEPSTPSEPAAPAENSKSPKEIAESYVDKSLSGLIAEIGEPGSSDYAPSCLGDGEDGELFYDGFTVYTYREGEKETVTYVE